jgi:hypothetical protein
LFKQQYPDYTLNLDEIRFLTANTVYELISKKQAFITKFAPKFNSNNDVTSQFVRNLGETIPRKHSDSVLPKLVIIVTMENIELITFSSISVAAKALYV